MKINLNQIFSEYELIDCGNGLKLERFGDIALIRPEVSAANHPGLNKTEWLKVAHAEFISDSKNSGSWKIYKNIPESWKISFEHENSNIVADLALTNSKHIGIFPEQALNWKYILDYTSNNSVSSFLNLFGYTGLSSIVAAHNSEKVTHIDSIKKVVEWTKNNAELNNLNNIRCINEDAPKFVKREQKRNNKYQGIILDPPAIGVGANREKWVFEKNIDDLLLSISHILDKKAFVIMNFYSHSVNEKFIHRLILTYFKDFNIEYLENIYGVSRYGGEINHGYFIRLYR